jgi:hypothetical protein
MNGMVLSERRMVGLMSVLLFHLQYLFLVEFNYELYTGLH